MSYGEPKGRRKLCKAQSSTIEIYGRQNPIVVCRNIWSIEVSALVLLCLLPDGCVILIVRVMSVWSEAWVDRQS